MGIEKIGAFGFNEVFRERETELCDYWEEFIT